MSKRGEIFDVAPVTTPRSSWFDMSNDNLLSCGAGTIVPHNCIECIAGDHIRNKTSVFGRVAPMVAPTFGKVDVMTYDFYVRYRDIWPDFDEFITNQSQDDAVVKQGFVAPVMLQASVQKLLLNKDFADTKPVFNETADQGELVSPTGWSPILHIFFKANSDFQSDPMTMELIYPYEVTMDPTNMTIPYNEDSGYINLYFSLSPTRKDVARYFDWLNANSDITFFDKANTAIFYNYLGDGDLLELLGVDMTAWYRKQARTFVDHVVALWHSNRLTLSAQSAIDRLSRSFEQVYEAIADRVVYSLLVSYETDPDWSLTLGGLVVHESNTATPQSQAVIDAANAAVASLVTSVDYQISLLPVMAYNFVYDEYFRDQNYIDKSITKKIATGVVDVDTYIRSINQYTVSIFDFFTLRRKSYMHDPYTTALPNAQRGDAVRYLSDAVVNVTAFPSEYRTEYGLTLKGISSKGTVDFAASGPSTESVNASLNVDLSAATIENFRWANAMQRYLESVNRTGGRYFEYIYGIFGKEVPDSKINRPIYLNGNRIPLQISEVLQTSQTDFNSEQALGDMAGRGVVVGQDEFLDYEVPDFGLFLQLSVVVPRTSYMTGLDPMFTRETYLDYPIPQFAQLGEEYVRTSELWFDGSQASFDKPFGYQSRYYQWKYRRDVIHSDFKRTLDFWHWSRKFTDEPVNGQEFLEINPDYRQFAVVDRDFDHYYLYFDHSIEMSRPLPTFGVPTL